MTGWWQDTKQRQELEARLREADAIVRDLAAELHRAQVHGQFCPTCGVDLSDPWDSHAELCIARRARVYVEREDAREATE